MRDIKFRAWDWENILYADDFFSWLWCDYFQINNKEWALHNHEENYDICDFDDWDIMQYTWLKDKNWVEIYEWDVVKIINDLDKENMFFLDKTLVSKVVFNKWAFKYIHKDKSESILYNWYKTIEVIWNIYENSNLI